MLFESQRFALKHIYCAPAQDRQFSFRMNRINKKTFPALREVVLYGAAKKLPNTTSYFHVFTVGNLTPELMGLKSQAKHWLKDQWVKLSDDMNERNFIAKVYNEDGVIFPRQHVYYSFLDESSLVFAVEVNSFLQLHFDIGSFQYLNVYSNAYFNLPEFNNLPNRVGISCFAQMVGNNYEKRQLQVKVEQLKTNGGDVFVYVDGYQCDKVTLNIPDQSYVEIVYDQSIVGVERFEMKQLRTFESTKDNKVKYLLYRPKQRDTIEYHDDCEIYISQSGALVNRGLLLYRHQDYVMRNVTDKDYSVYSMFANNTALALSTKWGGSIADKVVTLYVRQGGRDRALVYNAMKLHELYKLPLEVQHNVVSNTNYTVSFYRAEQLENSAYFACAGASSIGKITPQLAMQAVGYNGMAYYYANTPVVTQSALTFEVPELYQQDSLAFEYDKQGRYLRMVASNGPLYTCTDADVGYVDFMVGSLPRDYANLHPAQSTIAINNSEYRVLSAYFDNGLRVSAWSDITDNSALCTWSATHVTVKEAEGKKVKLVDVTCPRVYDLQLELNEGRLEFPLTQPEDRGNGIVDTVLDVPYENIEIYLNGYRLCQGLDWFLKFPTVAICNKRYIDYTQATQHVHIRMSGFTMDPQKINQLELTGFVNNGALTRNRHYDLREDKVLSAFIDGRMQDRTKLVYSEEDNQIRTIHSLNGKPYILKEPFIAMKRLTGVDTYPVYCENIQKNQRISQLYDLIHPEPAMDQFNVIDGAHQLFSPLVSVVINHVKQGVIPASFYSTPYDDTATLQLLEENYKVTLTLDPIRTTFPAGVVEIHPHLGNGVISLNLLQYRFIQNVVRLITGNRPERINLSGYLSIST